MTSLALNEVFMLTRASICDPLRTTSFIPKTQLNKLEDALDSLFSKLNIDIDFTRHFYERLNDSRNRPNITPHELVALFNETYRQYGKKITELDSGQEAVLRDDDTFINLPFVLEIDPRSRMLVMKAKTIMRKPNFRTPDPVFSV